MKGTGKSDGLTRRNAIARLSLAGIGLFLLSLLLVTLRFLMPRTRLRGPRYLRACRPGELAVNTVDQRWLAEHRLWLVRTHKAIFALYARCTHLGCTPAWDPAARKFKCPCHGSGFALDGTNLEGPAPIPLERFPLSLDREGRLLVDLGTRLVKRGEKRWSGPGAELEYRGGVGG